MEEYDLGRDISDAAMQRGISPVEMRGQLIQTMLQDDGKTISDKDRDLYAMGEISLAEAVKRSKVDRTLRTDVKALTGRMQKGIAGLRPKIEDFQEYMFGAPSYRDAEAGMGRTLSDLDQVQALAADSLPTSDRDVLNMLQEGRTLSNQDLAIGRDMSDQDFATRKISQDFQQYLQGILNESGANISDRDRQIIQDFMGSNVDPNTLSDRDRQIIEELFKRKRSQGKIISDSDAAMSLQNPVISRKDYDNPWGLMRPTPDLSSYLTGNTSFADAIMQRNMDEMNDWLNSELMNKQ